MIAREGLTSMLTLMRSGLDKKIDLEATRKTS